MTTRRFLITSLASLGLLVGAPVGLTGCERQSETEEAAEEAGEAVEEGAEEAGDALEDAADEMQN